MGASDCYKVCWCLQTFLYYLWRVSCFDTMTTLRSKSSAEQGWTSVGITEDSALLRNCNNYTMYWLFFFFFACMAFWKTLFDFDRYLWNVMTFSLVARVELEMSDCPSYSCPTPCHLWHLGHLLFSSVFLWTKKKWSTRLPNWPPALPSHSFITLLERTVPA